MALVIGKQNLARLSGMASRMTGWICPTQLATMRATYGQPYPYEKPYPYETKRLNLLREWFDNSKARMNENSKVIIVDGNMGVGKNEFARRLAYNFDLKLFESTKDSSCFVRKDNKFDLRDLNDLLPERMHFYDLKKWLTDPIPTRGRVGALQLDWYQEKFAVYSRALLHLFSTGQGVVIVRPPFSDHVIVEAMRKCGYVTDAFSKFHKMYQDNSACDLLKPHLSIYLDAPVDVAMERLKERQHPAEHNSAILTKEFFTEIDKQYKNVYLPQMRKSGEVLEVDWSQVGDSYDTDMIAEEIETLTLSTDDAEESRFRDWWMMTEDDMGIYRRQFNDERWQMFMLQRRFPSECPEIQLSYDDFSLFNRVVLQHPAIKYEPGWAPEFGHSVAFKLL